MDIDRHECDHSHPHNDGSLLPGQGEVQEETRGHMTSHLPSPTHHFTAPQGVLHQRMNPLADTTLYIDFLHVRVDLETFFII